MLKKINIEGAGFKNPVIVVPENVAESSWVSVFLGENGSKKSLLLRVICEAALGRNRFLPVPRMVIGMKPVFVNDALPTRVIAISGTPLDRFPRAGTTNLNRKRRATHFEAAFRYLGQRASNGMAGVGQSERGLVGSIMSNRLAFKERKDVLKEIFGGLHLEPYVGVRLRLANRRESDLADVLWSSGAESEFESRLRKRLDEIYVADVNQDDVAEQYDNRSSHFSLLSDRSASDVRKILGVFEKPQLALSLSPERIAARPGTFSVGEWELLIRLGLVEVDSTEFRPKATNGKISKLSQKISGDSLSSGQWSWLTSFVGLCVELRENSLVLIDEPENSLHPRWQQDYLPTLEKVLGTVNKYQVIVATHSPLIASGVSPETGNVRTLRRQKAPYILGSLVASEQCESTFGWTASDVYEEAFGVESTRAPKFTSTADRALELIRENQRLPVEDARSLILELENDIEILPALDPMRDVVKGVISSLKRLVIGGRNKL